MKLLWQLYAAFFRIGICTFGGGYAMLPMLEREIVNKYKWSTTEEILDYFAIGQCTPGVIAVNTATFVGYKMKGDLGGIAATLGVISPSVVIITVIAMLLKNFMSIEIVSYAFAGIRIAVCALILNTILGLVKKTMKKWWHVLIGVAAFVLAAFLKIGTIYIVLVTLLVSVLYYFAFARKGAKK